MTRVYAASGYLTAKTLELYVIRQAIKPSISTTRRYYGLQGQHIITPYSIYDRYAMYFDLQYTHSIFVSLLSGYGIPLTETFMKYPTQFSFNPQIA